MMGLWLWRSPAAGSRPARGLQAKARTLAGAIAAIALASAGAQAQAGPAPPGGAEPREDPGRDRLSDRPAGPALWKISRKGTTIYLFGTVHALPRATHWRDTRIERAFASAGELVTEIDLSRPSASAQALARAARLETGGSLRQLLSEEERALFEAQLARLGLPAAALDGVEPWFAAINLAMLALLRSGIDPAAGVDTTLAAAAGGKARSALETVEQQVALFDRLPLEAQLALLGQTLAAAPRAAANLEELVRLWLAGDADGLAARMNAALADPQLRQQLLVERNARWADWIEARLERPGTAFVAVGAGHLAGEGSVQDLLARRGHAVERIWR